MSKGANNTNTVNILVSDSLSEKGVELLKDEANFNVVVKAGLTHDELLKEIGNYEALIVRSATKVNKELIEAATKLRIIGRAGIGVDNIDVEPASKKGIIVMNSPGGNIITTAEHTIAMLLSLSRKIPQANALLKEGKWTKKALMGVEITGKTLGVIGLGRIGSVVVKRSQGLGMNVIAYDPFISHDKALDIGIELVSLEDLLKRSDYITLHVPKTKETSHLLGEKEFAMMKDGVRIINCARGGIIDENALCNAIKDKKVAGAALDVFEVEPPINNPLLMLDEVICTPHLGASTDEAQEKVAIDIAQQIINYLKDGQIRNAVNLPSIDAEILVKIKPYLELSECLGSVLAQIIEGGIKKIKVTYSGDVAKYDIKLLTLSLLKGILKFFAEDVNYVNASLIAKERGIEVSETLTGETREYTNLLRVVVESDKQTRLIEGTIFGKSEPRIVKIDDYLIEASPSNHMLIFSNMDKPGVIGHIGTFLGLHNINIAGMHLGRTKPHGKAVAIVNIDSPLSPEILEGVKKTPYILFVKQIIL